MTQRAIAGLILSGGASRRMGSPKALLPIYNETFIDRLTAVLGGACSPMIAVLGHSAREIQAGMRTTDRVRLVINPEPERGMLSSLQCGLRAIVESVDAVIFTPVDYPAIQATTVDLLARAFCTHGAPVTVPVHEGKRGHPVCLSRAVVAELLALPVTAQARDVVRAYRGQTQLVEVRDAGILNDIDSPEEYRALTSQLSFGAAP